MRRQPLMVGAGARLVLALVLVLGAVGIALSGAVSLSGPFWTDAGKALALALVVLVLVLAELLPGCLKGGAE